jgi:2-(1,2-epoxy-1,2-dihydrophenyl)acetyl-CoA isomerase
MLGDKISAQEAERMGMIYRVIEDENFGSKAWELAVKLAQLPTVGLALTKEAFALSASQTLEEQLQTEDKLQQMAALSADFAEGVQSFLEKRAPVFTGK